MKAKELTKNIDKFVAEHGNEPTSITLNKQQLMILKQDILKLNKSITVECPDNFNVVFMGIKIIEVD